MTNSELRRQTLSAIVGHLRNSKINGDLHDSLDTETEQRLCKVELEVAKELERLISKPPKK